MTPVEKAAAIMQRHGLVAMPALKDELALLIQDCDRLRAGIRDYLDGEYPNPRQHRPGRCDHGRFYWEACDNCTDAHFEKLLAATEEPAS